MAHRCKSQSGQGARFTKHLHGALVLVTERLHGAHMQVTEHLQDPHMQVTERLHGHRCKSQGAGIGCRWKS